jgi:hypothetical protein
MDMTVRGSPRREAAHSIYCAARLLDLAVAPTAGDYQRGAADAEGADRGDAHTQEVRTGDGERAWHRGGAAADLRAAGGSAG